MKTPEQKSADANRKRLWELYRITPEDQATIEAYQRAHGMSILMGQTLAGTGTDHDHASGLIRGRLAYLLNKAMGFIDAYAKGNSPEILRALANYAERPPATEALGAPRYGLIGKAQKKKKMIYGPPSTEKGSS